MSEEVSRLRRLYQHATAVQRLMESLRAAAPEAAEGTDQTGCVRITIGSDGLPARIRVEDGWQRVIDPGALGGAVLAAFTAATAEGMCGWSDALEHVSWRSRTEDLAAARGQGGPDPVPDVATYGPPRDVRILAEDALRALSAVRGQLATGPVGCTGASPGGHVSLTLSPAGVQACSVSPEWASHQDRKALNTALDQALSAAGEELTRQTSQRWRGNLDDLANDALTALRHLRTHNNEPGGR